MVGPPGLAATVEPWKFPLRVGASPPAEEVAKIWAQVATMTHDDVGSLVIGEIFCRLNSGALLPVMRATCEDWTPDLVLRDPTEFASAVAAEEQGIPPSSVSATVLPPAKRVPCEVAATPLQDFRPAVDERIAESTYLTLFPEVLDESPFSDTRRYRLPTRRRPASDGLPDWWPGNSDPLVYVTFGTVAPRCPAWCRCTVRCWTQSRALPVRVLLTVGRDT